MTEREFTVIVEQDEDGWFIGHVPELHACHSQGRTLDELMERMREVIRLCLEDEADEHPAARVVGVHRIAV